ncbi:MAG: hypothetical protein CL537_04980 [Alcanivoracaceae bacterium]|nr:hypothetical protein [Alcanivoracaceae bacterium]|tara:strand:- start:13182 stop:14222 length:1041 start_codon:yes stop_codon:yes gene_type:complete
MILIIGSRAREATSKAQLLFRKAFNIEAPVYLGQGDMADAQLCIDPLLPNGSQVAGAPRPGPFLPRVLEKIRKSCLPWRYHPSRTRVICEASRESRVVLEALMSFPWLLPPDSLFCVLKPPIGAGRQSKMRYEELLDFIQKKLKRQCWSAPDYDELPDLQKPTIEAFWLSHKILNDLTDSPPEDPVHLAPPLLVFACSNITRKRLCKNLPSVSFETLLYEPEKGMSAWGEIWSCIRGRHVLIVWDMDEFGGSDTGNSLRFLSEFSCVSVWSVVGLPNPYSGVYRQQGAALSLAKYPFDIMAAPELIGVEGGLGNKQCLDLKYSRMRKAIWRWLKEWEEHHLSQPSC